MFSRLFWWAFFVVHRKIRRRNKMADLESVSKLIEEKGIEIVDVKFTDLFGQWHHFSMPIEAFELEVAFEEGMGFDGSSIRGFQSIENSDMILIADPATAIVATTGRWWCRRRSIRKATRCATRSSCIRRRASPAATSCGSMRARRRTRTRC
jgi:hypothetical protein